MIDILQRVLLVLVGILLGLILGSIASEIKRDTYKYGQVDAINGIIKWHLVTQPDSSKIWMKTE